MEFESVAANLRESFRVVAAHRAAGELQEMEGVSIASAGVTFQMFNAAFLSAPVVSEGQMDLRVAQAAVHFATRGTNVQAQPNKGYLLTNDAPVTVTLPALVNVGDVVRIACLGVNGWTPGCIKARR